MTALRPIAPAGETLAFGVREGRAQNAFHRAGPVAAHFVFSDGAPPRFVAALPAGASGALLLFEGEAAWTDIAPLRSVEARLAGARLLGVEAEASLDVGAAGLVIAEAVLGSVRSLRERIDAGAAPAEIASSLNVNASSATWSRLRLDGARGYALRIEMVSGRIEQHGGAIRILPDTDGRLRLKLAALTGDAPLTPIPREDLLTGAAAPDRASADVLAFLSYKEKLLAGSWRFPTYFGRDTLMTLSLLGEAAGPRLVEAGLASVIERLDADGAVAHEEDIADFALLRRASGHGSAEAGDAPLYDYAMIDDDFMLAPLAADYLLDREDGAARAAAFLARRNAEGEAYGALLVRNLRYVLAAARPFAAAPSPATLLSLKAGRDAGEWRDSREGLGGGRIPFNVNAALVPSALEAAARLLASEALAPYAADADDAADEARRLAGAWRAHARDFFGVRIENAAARESVRAYAESAGIDPAAALAALGDAPAEFTAVALGADGAPVPVLHSDEGFVLAFADPPESVVAAAIDAMLRPFPAGLLTPVGLVVANPAYAPPALQEDFSNRRYHGAVVWSWQQALLAKGLARQRARPELSAPLRARLAEVETALWAAIAAGEALRTSELWSWSAKDGGLAFEPFGQRAGDATESNAAQLWSTVYLGVEPPQRDDP